MTMKHTKQSIISKDGVSYLIPFILITSCFALWGFANDITNPMVKAFSKIFRMSATDGALVQVAFYGGYFAMAFPAAIFIRKYSYKAGVLLGLGMYAFGAFLFFPAKMTGEYYPFLIAYFILTCGLSFLETSCNPYILSMGTEETATRRLNLAQSFNPMGSLLGMYVAMQFIQAKLHPMCTEERSLLNDSEFQAIKESDLTVLIAPYLIIGLIILAMLIVIRLVKMPKNGDQNHKIDFFPTLKRIFMETRYREGVIAQFFYVGAQIMCWTFIIQYGTHLFMSPDFGMDEKSAEVLSQQYNIIAMVIFCVSRFINSILLFYSNFYSFYLHFYPALSQCWKITDDSCYLRRSFHIGHHLPSKHFRTLLSGSSFRLYVTDVPNHLRYCLERYGRRCQIRGSRSYHGYFGRFHSSSATSKHY